MAKAYNDIQWYIMDCFQETYEMLGDDFWKDSNVGYEKFIEYGTNPAMDAMRYIDGALFEKHKLLLAKCFRDTYRMLGEKFWK